MLTDSVNMEHMKNANIFEEKVEVQDQPESGSKSLRSYSGSL